MWVFYFLPWEAEKREGVELISLIVDEAASQSNWKHLGHGQGVGWGVQLHLGREGRGAPRMSWEFHRLGDGRLVLNLLSFVTFSQMPEYILVLVILK